MSETTTASVAALAAETLAAETAYHAADAVSEDATDREAPEVVAYRAARRRWLAAIDALVAALAPGVTPAYQARTGAVAVDSTTVCALLQAAPEARCRCGAPAEEVFGIGLGSGLAWTCTAHAEGRRRETLAHFARSRRDRQAAAHRAIASQVRNSGRI